MGWARSLYVPTGSSPISEVNEKPGFDLDVARRIAKNSRGYVRDPTPELLAISSGGRDPVSDSDPPFIPPEEVARHDNVVDGIWIIVEDRVYDVSDFMDIHPGGPSMFEQFAGKQCTWQFWRFHRKKHLTDWSEALLIGRTSPVPPNPYKEPPRWIKTS